MTRLLLTSALGALISLLLFSNYSLAGLWTDAIVLVLLLAGSFFFLFVKTYTRNPADVFLKGTWFLALAVCLAGSWRFFSNPFFIDYFKLRTFSSLRVNGRRFNAYFKPVGAYSGGYGNFWISERVRWLPFLEREVYYEHAVHWNFNDDSPEGEPVDNAAVARQYVADEVLRKGR